ncbi:MAG: tyrosine-protein phosphatase [Clostridia bacterium]|nr:tyrosine-protein phosphatase [Clostridia bacterium]
MGLKKTIALSLAALSVSLFGFSACGEEKERMDVLKIQCKTYAGQSIDCTPPVYQTYLSLTDEKDIAKLLFEHNNKGNFKPVPKSGQVVLSWERDESNYNRYTVWVSENEDLSDPCFQTQTQDVYAVVEGLMPGKYYWKVADASGKESDVDAFTVVNYVRALDVDEIKNFRDLGGWKTESGKTVQYGLTYRSAALKASSGSALRDLGVKTEIDLRAEEEYSSSIIPEQYGIRFLQAGIMQGDYVLKDKSFYSSLTPEQIEEKRHSAAEFKQAYADALYEAFKLYTVESNYPILFHCTSGADRTGTFAFLLNGMLGVSVDDLYKDFELTCFSMGGKRWRSNIKKDEQGNYYFNDDGYVTVPDNYVAIGLLYKGLMECYATGDGKLSSAIKNYLRTDVGLTEADFQAIESIMLA